MKKSVNVLALLDNPVSKTDRLWQLLELALRDLKKAEKSSKCRIRMSVWYQPKRNGMCELCLAGSVMKFTLQPYCRLTEEGLAPDDFNDALGARLIALDALRCGEIETAGDAFYESLQQEVTRLLHGSDKVTHWSDSSGTFSEYLTEVLVSLRARRQATVNLDDEFQQWLKAQGCRPDSHGNYSVPDYTPTRKRKWWAYMRHMLTMLKKANV